MLDSIKKLDLIDITIDAKDIFDKYIGMNYNQVSEITFTNLFIWRHQYKLKYAVCNDYLYLISFKDSEKPYAFLPMGNMESKSFLEAIKVLQQYFDVNGYELIIKKIYEDYVDIVLGVLGEDYIADYDRDNSDYLYLTSNLATLKGKKYHRKKNHVNKFMSTYNYSYEKIDSVNKRACYNILNKWLLNKKVQSDAYKEEVLAIKEIVENFENLDCFGAIINVDATPQGFTFGEKMNRDTLVIHLEKVNREIDGLGEFINWQFCKENFNDSIYINREQDLGIEGLRTAKKSYLPERLVNKYNIHHKR